MTFDLYKSTDDADLSTNLESSFSGNRRNRNGQMNAVQFSSSFIVGKNNRYGNLTPKLHTHTHTHTQGRFENREFFVVKNTQHSTDILRWPETRWKLSTAV